MAIYRISPDDAKQAVDEIVRDLTDRRGLSTAWAAIDDETLDEIRETWAKIIMLPPSESSNAKA